MSKYLVRIEWSQTDSSNVLVKARDAQDAKSKALAGTNALFASAVFRVDHDKT